MLLAFGLLKQSAAETARHHLVVALPAGLSPRTIGFYLAQEEGYFAERGITVDFITGTTAGATPGTTKDTIQAPSRLLADGKADLAVDLMPVALRLHQDGTAIQHVAQFFQHSSLGLYCRPPIAKPGDLHGTTIGVWFGGEESAFYAWMSMLNISTFGEEDGVTVLRQGRTAKALADSRLDCVTSTSYLAPLQMQANGITPGSRKVFRYDDLNVGTLEDGLYARTKDLQDKERVETFSQFLAASIRGWQKLHDDRASALRLFRGRDDLNLDQADSSPDTTTATDTNASTDTTGAAAVASNATPSNKKRNTAAATADANPGNKRDRQIKTAAKDSETNDASSADPSAGAAAAAGKAGNEPDPAALTASLDAIDALIDPSRYKIGLLDTDGYDRTVNLLLTGAPEPVLKSAPENATTDILWKHLHQTGTSPNP